MKNLELNINKKYNNSFNIFKFTFFFLFFLSSNVFAERLILECSFHDEPERKMNFHIDTDKQHLVQFDTLKYTTPQVALTYKSKFLLIVEIILYPESALDLNKKYNDNAKYHTVLIFMDINRYSGEFKMHRQSMDKKNMSKYLKKIKELRGTENIYSDILKFAQKNKGEGYRVEEDFYGNCSKSNKKF